MADEGLYLSRILRGEDPPPLHVPLPWSFALMGAPHWVQENAYAWHRMIHETEHSHMETNLPVDLKSTAARVFHAGGLGTLNQAPSMGPNGNVYDGHPDTLYEFAEHGTVCPVGWSMVVARSSNGLTPTLSVMRVSGTGDEEKHLPLMRPGYAHPSPEYAAEIARQVYARQRNAFAWDTSKNQWVMWPVASVLVFERTGPGWDDASWRQTHAFIDDDN